MASNTLTSFDPGHTVMLIERPHGSVDGQRLNHVKTGFQPTCPIVMAGAEGGHRGTMEDGCTGIELAAVFRRLPHRSRPSVRPARPLLFPTDRHSIGMF